MAYPATNLFLPNQHALHVHDDGNGPSLFVGADFKFAGNVASSGIAKWGPRRPVIAITQPAGPGSPVTNGT